MPEYEKLSDGKLVELSRSGSVDAYGELVSRTKNAVYRAAYGVIREHYMSEDIAQDAFTDAFIGLSRLKDAEKFTAWICSITRKKALHYVTRRRIYSDISSVEMKSREKDPAVLMADSETRGEIRDAVKELSDKNR